MSELTPNRRPRDADEAGRDPAAEPVATNEARAADARATEARAAMVARQLRDRGIRDERVLDAMARVPRERFVGADQRPHAYADGALPIPVGQTISQPYVVARMTELLAPQPGDRILEIGTGSGYQSAILAALGCRVVSYERHRELAETAAHVLAELGFAPAVEVRVGDGSSGDPAGARYDGIVVTAAAPSVPAGLREQLKDGGVLVIPVGRRERQDLIVIRRHGDSWDERSDGAVVFVPLVGEHGFPG